MNGVCYHSRNEEGGLWTVKKWVHLLLFLALLTAGLFEDAPLYDIPEANPDLLVVPRSRNDTLIAPDRAFLKDSNTIINFAARRAQSEIFRNICLLVKTFAASSPSQPQHFVSAKPRCDFPFCACPRQRGYALIFAVT